MSSYETHLKYIENPDAKYSSDVKHSALYAAMVKYGVDTFEMIEISEMENLYLNEWEIWYIEQYSTLSPNGYNLTSGGSSSFRFSETVLKRLREKSRKYCSENLHRLRRDETQGLPMYITYKKSKCGDGFAINNHPLCKFKCFYIKTYGSLENAKDEAIKFFNKLEQENAQYVKPKSGVDLPKGISVHRKGGYLVRKNHKGKTYEKRFRLLTRTDEENKAEAIKYLDQLIEKFKTI